MGAVYWGALLSVCGRRGVAGVWPAVSVVAWVVLCGGVKSVEGSGS